MLIKATPVGEVIPSKSHYKFAERGFALARPTKLGRELSGVSQADGTLERLGLDTAGAIEIGGRLFDEVHAFAEQRCECRRIGEPFVELNEGAFGLQTFHG